MTPGAEHCVRKGHQRCSKHGEEMLSAAHAVHLPAPSLAVCPAPVPPDVPRSPNLAAAERRGALSTALPTGMGCGMKPARRRQRPHRRTLLVTTWAGDGRSVFPG